MLIDIASLMGNHEGLDWAELIANQMGIDVLTDGREGLDLPPMLIGETLMGGHVG